MKTVPAILVYLASGKSALIQATESTLDLDDGVLIVHGEDEVGDVTFNWDHVAYYRDYDFEVPEEDVWEKLLEQVTPHQVVTDPNPANDLNISVGSGGYL
jgi:hypothetical protein